jgi:hypothetical protein
MVQTAQETMLARVGAALRKRLERETAGGMPAELEQLVVRLTSVSTDQPLRGERRFTRPE